MLDSLRNAAGSWVAKILLGLLILSFAVWGIAGRITGSGSTDVIVAGGTTVSATEYRLAYDRQIAAMSRQFGTRLTREQAVALGLDQQVLAQLVAGAVLDEEARQMKLGVSEDRVAKLTADDPAFQGPDGSFDRQRFEYVLRQVGMKPEDYLKNREEVAVRQQIVDAVSDGLTVPDTFLNALSLYQGEDRTVEYVAIPKSVVQPIPEPTDDQLKTYFDAHKSDYSAPEYRKFSYIKLEPSDIADEGAILDQQVKDYYDKNKARYTEPEKRTIQQVVFADKDAAQKALDAIRSGSKTFEDIVKDQGKTMDDVQLGTFTKQQVADEAVADAAFSLDQGQVSDVVNGNFGPVLVRVSDVQPETVKPYDEVKADIRHELALDEASRVIFDVHDSYEDARAGGATMKEAADKLHLDVHTIDAISQDATTPDGEKVKDLPDQDELLNEVFSTDVDVENPSLSIGPSGFLFYEVQGVTPARDRTLDEVHDKVVADWKAQEADKRLDDKVAELRKQVDDGKSMSEVAGELQLQSDIKRGLTRGKEDTDMGKAGVQAAFSVSPGKTAVAPTPEGDGKILMKVTQAVEPAASGPDTIPEASRKNFSEGMSNDLLDQLVARLQGKYDVRINRNAIDRAMAF